VSAMPRTWIAVASAEHVREGRRQGIMQVCHGKAAPLRRTAPGDRVIYYSPATKMRGTDGLQSFTAIGRIRDGALYQPEMVNGFQPWRRDVDWFSSVETPIRPLLEKMEFTQGRRNWGYQFRYGLFPISKEDGDIIEQAMRVGQRLETI